MDISVFPPTWLNYVIYLQNVNCSQSGGLYSLTGGKPLTRQVDFNYCHLSESDIYFRCTTFFDKIYFLVKTSFQKAECMYT